LSSLDLLGNDAPKSTAERLQTIAVASFYKHNETTPRESGACNWLPERNSNGNDEAEFLGRSIQSDDLS
jgi:hypothetical protein